MGSAGEISIFAYPTNTFLPTDFHTAIVDKDRIIIEDLRYPEDREFWRTPIYILHLESLGVNIFEGKSEEPDWIFVHRAFLEGSRIVVAGGNKIDANGRDVALQGTFELHLKTMVCSRVD